MLPQTAQYRSRNEQLRAALAQQLLTVWPALSAADLDKSFPTWMQIVAVIVGRGRSVSAQLAGDYLAAFGERSPSNPDALPPAQFARASYGSVIAAKSVIADGRTVEEAMQVAYVRSLGAMSELVADAGRSTVMNTTIDSPKFSGWRRVTSGSGCSFCQMLAGRGGVYSDKGARFSSHRHCSCSAEPVSADGLSAGQRQEVVEYKRSERRFSDADRARVRAWMKANT